jgi:hypothetical protein
MARVAVIVLWSGRILAIGLLALWGAFFVEHLGWFLKPVQGLPPARVWLLQLAHLTLLVGLLMLFRWEVPGGILTVVAALVFFAAVAGPRFPLFFGATILPVALVLLGRLLQLRWGSVPPVP